MILEQIPTSRRQRSRRRNPKRRPVCEEWTKIFNKTNLLHLGDNKGVKEKCEKNGVGVSRVVEFDGDWIILHPFTHLGAFDRPGRLCMEAWL